MKSNLWNRFIWQEVDPFFFRNLSLSLGSIFQIDIRLPENAQWFGRYRYEIPVFHLNEKFLMKNRVDLKLLEEKLDVIEP